MIFTSQVTMSGQCKQCWGELGIDGMIHQDEAHPIHKKCLEIWIAQQAEQPHSQDTSPICYKNIQKIEEKDEALLRMVDQGNNMDVEVLMKNNRFFIEHNTSALYLATNKGYSQIIKIILENGKDFTDKALETVLKRATQNGDITTLRILLEYSNHNGYGFSQTILKNCLSIAKKNAKKQESYQEIINELQPRCQKAKKKIQLLNFIKPIFDR